MSEPRYLSGDEYAHTGGYEELVNCNECDVEFDQVEYRSDTCSDCEDKRVIREKDNKMCKNCHRWEGYMCPSNCGEFNDQNICLNCRSKHKEVSK